MEWFMDLITNEVLVATAIAWALSQGAKIIINTVKKGPDIKHLVQGGGMPSAHSATFLCLTVSTYLVYGGGSFEFVIALFVMIIVVYDAHGVRYQSGLMGRYLNRISRQKIEEGKPEDASKVTFEEVMGHTTPEIIVGLILGAVVAIVTHLVFGA